jgi:hypothetical protein
MARKDKEKDQDVRDGGIRAPAMRPSMNLPMKYLVISGRDEMKISRSIDGRVEDLSLTGLVFQTASMRVDNLHLSYDESPVVRNKLTMEIDLPGKRKITAMGEVSWYERSFVAKEQIYHIGVVFREISPEDREALKEYLVAVKRAVAAVSLDDL